MTERNKNPSWSPRRATTGPRMSPSSNPSVATPGRHEIAGWAWHTTPNATGSRLENRRGSRCLSPRRGHLTQEDAINGSFSKPCPRRFSEPGDDYAQTKGDNLGQDHVEIKDDDPYQEGQRKQEADVANKSLHYASRVCVFSLRTANSVLGYRW